MDGSLEALATQIHDCQRCPRLRVWCQGAAGQKALYREYPYWARPVSGFGDSHARLLVIGLAPGRHGANRTGRPFTGDAAGEWLYDALYRYGFANQPVATDRTDGLQLQDAYISNLVRCAPPGDRPTPAEIDACSSFFEQELQLLTSVEGVLALGRIAFEGYGRWLRQTGILNKRLPFEHAKLYQWPRQPWLMASYHCSQRNTRSGRLTRAMWDDVFQQIRELLPSDRPKNDIRLDS